MAIQPLSLFKRTRRGIRDLLFDDEEDQQQSPLSLIADDDGETSTVEKSRKGYLESLSDQKVRNISDFFIDEPERPELDADRMKNLQNLSKVAAISEFINALTQVVPRARSDASDRTSPVVESRGGDLGLSAFQMLREQDTRHRDLLERFRREVGDINRYNTQLGFENLRRNQQVDTKEAQAQLEFAMQDKEAARMAEQEKERLKREGKLADREAWRQAGLRLITQGEEKAGLAALGQSGLSTEEITELLRTGGGERETDPKIINAVIEMRRLAEEIRQGEPGEHFTFDGEPITPKARRLQKLQDEIGLEEFSPEVQKALQEYDRNQLIERGKNLRQQLLSAPDTDAKRDLASQLYDTLIQLGADPAEAEQRIRAAAGVVDTGQTQQEDEGLAGGDFRRPKDLSTLSLDELGKEIERERQSESRQRIGQTATVIRQSSVEIARLQDRLREINDTVADIEDTPQADRTRAERLYVQRASEDIERIEAELKRLEAQKRDAELQLSGNR